MDDWNQDEEDARTLRIYEGSDPELLSDCLDWEAGGRVHNWRNHVGERTKRIWPSLTREQRIAVWLDADDSASNENWD